MTLTPDISALLPADQEIRTRRDILVGEIEAHPPRRRRSRKFGASLGVIIVAGGATAAYAAVDFDFGDSPTPRYAASVKTDAAPAVERDIADHFAIFRDRPADPVPAALVPQIASAERVGRNADLARSFRTPYGKAWVIPGRGFLCLAVPTPTAGHATNCVPTQLAIKRGVWLRLAGDDGGKVLDTLVVPDGTDAVVNSTSERTVLNASADGVISEFVHVDRASGPRLIPQG